MVLTAAASPYVLGSDLIVPAGVTLTISSGVALRLPEAVRRAYDLSSLRWAIHAGGPCAADVKRAIVFIFPDAAGAKPPYRMMVINDGAAAFPKAETRVLNLTNLELAMKAGEHSVKLPASKVSTVPKVTRRNDLNQAQTEFYRKGKGANEWQLLAERPMQFTDGIRNIILVYQMPKVEEPQLRTLVDTDLP